MRAPLRAVGCSSVPRSVAGTAREYPIIASDPFPLISISIIFTIMIITCITITTIITITSTTIFTRTAREYPIIASDPFPPDQHQHHHHLDVDHHIDDLLRNCPNFFLTTFCTCDTFQREYWNFYKLVWFPFNEICHISRHQKFFPFLIGVVTVQTLQIKTLLLRLDHSIPTVIKNSENLLITLMLLLLNESY